MRLGHVPSRLLSRLQHDDSGEDTVIGQPCQLQIDQCGIRSGVEEVPGREQVRDERLSRAETNLIEDALVAVGCV